MEYLGDWDNDGMNEFALGVRQLGSMDGEVRVYQCTEDGDNPGRCLADPTTGFYELTLEGAISGNWSMGEFWDIGVPHWIASGDIDGDGSNELVLGAKGNYYGSSTTTFAVYDADAAGSPALLHGPIHGCGRGVSTSFGTADVDGDGDDDVVITEYASGADAGLVEYWNPTTGVFHYVSDRIGTATDLVDNAGRRRGPGDRRFPGHRELRLLAPGRGGRLRGTLTRTVRDLRLKWKLVGLGKHQSREGGWS